MSESGIQTKVLKWLRDQGAYAVNIHGHEMQERGIPDILCCWKGLFIGIELKEPGGEPEPIQEYHLEQIAKANGSAFCAHNLEEVQYALRGIDAVQEVHEIELGKVKKKLQAQ